MKVFCFYGHDPKKVGIKACLSQWYMCDFTVDGHLYHCMEQYMMAQKALKFKDYDTLQKILSSKEPKEIKELGRQVKNFNSQKWDEVKRDIVYKGNLAKFTQNENLKKFLLSLGDVTLAEASPYDIIWGIGMREGKKAQDLANWQGQNLLGYALTKVKETIEAETVEALDVNKDDDTHIYPETLYSFLPLKVAVFTYNHYDWTLWMADKKGKEYSLNVGNGWELVDTEMFVPFSKLLIGKRDYERTKQWEKIRTDDRWCELYIHESIKDKVENYLYEDIDIDTALDIIIYVLRGEEIPEDLLQKPRGGSMS